MLAVDTNVVVRYLTNDEPAQARAARKLIDGSRVKLQISVLLETAWVLSSLFEFADERVHAALVAFIGLENVSVEQPARVATALGWFEQGIDLADALHLAGAEDCEAFVTFDRRLIATGRKAKAGNARLLT
jgi:predicted nucleic-acid-binding protein